MASNTDSAGLTVDRANQLLKSFDCTNPNPRNNICPSILRQAILTLVNQADYYILGICAESIIQGYAALLDYGNAFGDRVEYARPEHSGPTYIKFNKKTRLFHVDSYSGNYRGVLVSCQSAYDHGVNDLYGYLPLNLFAEETNSPT